MGKLMERSDSHTDCKSDQPCIEMSPLTTPNSPLDLSIHSKRFPFNPRATIPVDLSTRPSSIFAPRATTSATSDAPVILNQPKSEWHYRSLKDLANNHLPLLAGNGRQRTPIRVSVPEACGFDFYLAIRIVTMKLYPHPSKVIVPSKTTVGSLPPTHDNDLKCLHFDENSSDFVDLDERRIYSRVTPDEHRRGEKDVRVHMFNLYQNQQITKERIESEELTRCKLSFGFYVLQNGQFIPVSRLAFSDTIEEKKMTPRSRASLQPHVLSASPVSNSRSSETDSNPDAMEHD